MPKQPDGRYAALGQVVENAAVMEISLRMVFCALVDSKYAAVVADYEETHTLIENCAALTRHRRDLADDQRAAIHAALKECRKVNSERNRLVHDAWNQKVDGAPETVRSQHRTYEISGRCWTADAIQTVADALLDAQRLLLTAAEDALGPEQLLIGDKLRDDERAHGGGA
jgi:hypothetical protein